MSMINATDPVLRDVGVLFGTLFNHRRPVERESKHFAKTFETKYLVTGSSMLDTSVSEVGQKQQMMQEAAAMAAHLPDLQEQIEMVAQYCDEVVGTEAAAQTQREARMAALDEELSQRLADAEVEATERKAACDAHQAESLASYRQDLFNAMSQSVGGPPP